MKKIYIGGHGACGVHSEKQILSYILGELDKVKRVDDYKEADLIVLTDMCISTGYEIVFTLEKIDNILAEKKENAQVIVSGCLSKGLKHNLSDEHQKTLSKVTIKKPNELLQYVIEKVNTKVPEKYSLDIKMPYRFIDRALHTSIVEGCLNNCSFCKSNYMNFDLKSIPLETIKRFKEETETQIEEKIQLTLGSSNLSQYGIDLYGTPKAHEAIKLLTSAENIQWAYVGALINLYPELVKEIINNEKIKNIFISLESGSKRVYDLMNRPISLEKLTETIKTIKRERPDIIIESELICGFPTETIDDFKRSLSLVEELDICPSFLHPYTDSSLVPAHNYVQKSIEYNYALMLYGEEKLKRICTDFENRIENGEQLVLFKSNQYNCYHTMLVNGAVRNVSYNQLDRVYEQGEIILPNTIKPKQLAKRFNN